MSQPMAKVSIITVCYNSAATIAATLDSVARQRWGSIEHILIDGGSRDGTQDIIARYPHVSTFVSEPDKGIYDAMNKGIDRATGDIICFLNADDFYADDQVIAHAATEMTDGQLDAFFGDVDYFRLDEPGKVVRRYSSRRFRPDRFAWGVMPAHPALFLKRSEVSRVGHFKADYRIAGDFDLVARVFLGQALRYRHDPRVMVHMALGGISTNGFKSTVLMNREVMRSCRENGIRTHALMVWSKYLWKIFEFFPGQHG